MSDQQPVTGLQDSIWKNNAKSIALMVIYPFILSAVVYAAVAVFGFMTGHAVSFDAAEAGVNTNWQAAFAYSSFVTAQYWPMILTVVVVWFILAYVFQGTLIRALSKSHGVSRKEEPALYNLVENMCISRGLKMPRLEIIESHARNAFASGVDEGTYCITVTRGLMQSLAQDELEAVLAHELTHIINRDVRLLMVCVIFTGMLGLSAQLLWSYLRYGIYLPRGGQRREGGGGGMLLLFALLAILGIGYLATLLTRFAISRRREYMADAGAVQITKNPDAMMRALLRISGAADIPAAPADIRAMCFENAHAFMGVFATHPPIGSRIRAIADFSGLPVPNQKPKISASDEEAFGRPAEPRDNWTTRQRFKNRRANPWR